MSARTFPIDVVTPERRVWRGPVEMVVAKGTEGQLGILADHAPLITALVDGVLRLRLPGGAELPIVCEGGFLEVSRGGVTVLASGAKFPDEVQVEQGTDEFEV